jgi:cytoskeletal protein RodZ
MVDSVPTMDDARAERVVSVAVMVVAAIIGSALVWNRPDRRPVAAAIAATSTLPTSTTAATTEAAPTPAQAPSTTAPTSTAATTTPDPGALPQTTDEPVASGATFDAGVNGLWDAIVRDEPSLGLPFFFPKSAYLQVKAIADPASDYEQRLIANYAQDIHTLHARLGADASTAHFEGIDVPSAQAVLVQPGEESNKLPYWRVYGTTIRYSVGGNVETLPVTSLISWRGEWYVVHLGEIR